jgi:hypothetical protein
LDSSCRLTNTLLRIVQKRPKLVLSFLDAVVYVLLHFKRAVGHKRSDNSEEEKEGTEKQGTGRTTPLWGSMVSED